MSLALCLFVIAFQELQAAVIGYDFTGLVTFVQSDPYGVSIPAFSPITGRFLYDTSSSGVPGSAAGSMNYRQNFPLGFIANFGGVPVSADTYDVQLANDFPQLFGGPIDSLSIIFADNLVPAPADPLYVLGIPHTNGLFNLNLNAQPSTFADSSLPSSLNFGDFNSTFGVLSQSTSGNIDVFFSITSINPTPEPQLTAAFAIGSLGLGYALRRSKTLALN